MPDINGTPGDDTLDGTTGDDRIFGFQGNDVLRGHGGHDLIDGGTENDTIEGGEGNDVLFDFGGDDTIDGGAGNDRITDHGGTNLLLGGAGNDVMAGSGATTLDGGEGDDQLFLGIGNPDYDDADAIQTASGGGGADLFIVAPSSNGGARDRITDFNAAEGDRLQFWDVSQQYATTSAATWPIQGKLLFKGELDSALFFFDAVLPDDGVGSGFIRVWYTNVGGSMYLLADSNANLIFDEDDLVVEFAGTSQQTLSESDFVHNFVLSGSAGDDVLVGDNDVDLIYGGGGNDDISGLGQADQLYGQEGDDVLDAGSGGVGPGSVPNRLFGGNGNDTLIGGSGIDELYGEAGNDTLEGGGADDRLDGGDGNDLLDGGAGDNRMWGGAGNDLLQGGADGDALNGDAGDDTLEGGGGDDILTDFYGTNFLRGGDGNDILNASDRSTLEGGEGDDVLNIGNLNFISAGAPNPVQTASGGAGADLFVLMPSSNGSERDRILDFNGAEGDRIKLFGVTDGHGNTSYALSTGPFVFRGELNSSSFVLGSALPGDLGPGVVQLWYTNVDGKMYLVGDTDADLVFDETDLVVEFSGTSQQTLSESDFAPGMFAGRAGTSGADTLFGTDEADLIYGGGGNDEIHGMLGPDELHGNGGDDRLDGGTGADTLFGDSGDDLLEGGQGNDALNGGADDDMLDGGADADQLAGGTGDDIYIVDPGDTVSEAAGAGTDTIVSALGYVLAAGSNVENLTLTGTASYGYGNELDNVVTGNALDNYLSGGAGNDTLIGGLGTDNMVGGAGNDSYHVDRYADQATEAAGAGADTIVSTVGYTLAAGSNIENLTLVGNAGYAVGDGLDNVLTGNARDNFLSGGDGDDTLVGGLGADNMVGGLGNDIYHVDRYADQVTEGAGAGTDTIVSTVGWALAAGSNVENLTLAGSASYGVGNASANRIVGNAIANTLSGGGGNDALFGRGGHDSLSGGAGQDGFYFDASLHGATNIDQVLDFAAADDTIFLDRSIFSQIGADGALSASAFHAGTSAQDADDRIVYNSANGNIYYDLDGSGASAAILFATLAAGTALTAADFVAYTG